MHTVLKTERTGIRECTGHKILKRCTNAIQNNDNPLELFLNTNGLLSRLESEKYQVV